MVRIDPPFCINGAASRVMRIKECTEMSIACANPAFEHSDTGPCRSSLGQKAMECRTKSSPPHVSSMALNTASIWPSTSTSMGRNSGADSVSTTGAMKGFDLSLA